MTLRDQLLTVLHGGKADRVPFTCYEGLVPEGGWEIENLTVDGAVDPSVVRSRSTVCSTPETRMAPVPKTFHHQERLT